MIFDHDAILLDSIGASTPDQGTGIGINKEQLKVSHFIVGANERKIKAKNYLTNELSFSQVECALHKLINKDTNGNEYNYIVAVYDDYFIFETKNEMFKSNYEVDDLDNVSIQDTRLPVERVVEFKPINSTDIKEDNAMRDSIIAELAKLGITVNADVTDAELMAKYKEALVANEGDDGADGENVAEIVANAIKEAINPLTEKISGLETQLTANSNKDLEELAQFVVSSKKRPEFDLESLKSLGVDTVRNIAANCGS